MTGDVGTEKNPVKNYDGKYRPYLRPARHQVLTQTKEMNNVVQETINNIKGGL
jgi:hypothetical protein